MLAVPLKVRKNPHVMNHPSNPSKHLLPLAAALTTMASLFLAGCANVSAPAPSVASAGSSSSVLGKTEESRPGLGTKAGREVCDEVRRAQFYRKSSSPDVVASFYYNDEAGARAMADLLGGGSRRTGLIDLAGGRLRAGLVSNGDQPFPYLDAKTRQIVMGQPGESYQIRVENRTNHRQEVIVSVDSLNVLTGGVAGFSQRGFAIEPKGSLNIPGFRVNDETVRHFEFSSLAASKAAGQGQARNVGVIGLAVFEEDEARAKMMLRKEQFQRDEASAFPVAGR